MNFLLGFDKKRSFFPISSQFHKRKIDFDGQINKTSSKIWHLIGFILFSIFLDKMTLMGLFSSVNLPIRAKLGFNISREFFAKDFAWQNLRQFTWFIWSREFQFDPTSTLGKANFWQWYWDISCYFQPMCWWLFKKGRQSLTVKVCMEKGENCWGSKRNHLCKHLPPVWLWGVCWWWTTELMSKSVRCFQSRAQLLILLKIQASRRS